MKKPKVRRAETGARAAVIEALLAGESQAGAAAAAGISRRSVVRWLADPAFAAELETARAAAYAEALSMLKGGARVAVAALLQNLKAKTPAERRQAAREILTFAFKGIEVMDLETRLKHVEELLSAGGAATIGRAGRVS
jgi:hypothetical protein